MLLFRFEFIIMILGMRTFIYFLYTFLFVLLFSCCRRPTDQNPETFESWSHDSIKHTLKTQKITNEEKIIAGARLGIQYNMIGEYDSARLYLNLALSLPGGKEYQGGRLLTNLANSYGFQGRYTEALKFYMEALQISEQLVATKKDKIEGQNNIIRTMANLAEIYYLTGNRKQALHYAEEAKKRGEAEGWNYITPQYFYIIGSVYLERGEWDKAEKIMLEAYEITDAIYQHCMQSVGDPLGMYMYLAYSKEGLAQVYLARKEYTKALDIMAEALDFGEKHDDPTITAKILSAFSDIYLAQGNYEMSGQFARRALEMYPDYPKLNPGTIFNIAAASLFDNKKEEAYEYFQLYSVRMKENTDKQFHETMAGMEVLYETEKKEMRISDLEKQKIMYISISIAGLLLAMAIWIILHQKIKNERKEKQLIVANAILEWEKKERKRFASDLHDGINGMLSAIKLELNTEEHLQSIRDQLDNCIETIRRMARGMMPVSLERYGLKAALEDYCRLFHNVDFYFFGEDKHINEGLELAIYYCTYELVNNSFRHSGAKSINVQLIQSDSHISLAVQDDGCGFDKKSLVQGTGLNNINDRIAAFNGKIDVTSSPGKGTEINIELKIETYNGYDKYTDS